jgi:hypothetical protein
MKTSKGLGLDGFITVEFYKFFWRDISDHMIASFKESEQNGELSFVQREGLITCLPKSNETTDSKNSCHPS